MTSQQKMRSAVVKEEGKTKLKMHQKWETPKNAYF